MNGRPGSLAMIPKPAVRIMLSCGCCLPTLYLAAQNGSRAAFTANRSCSLYMACCTESPAKATDRVFCALTRLDSFIKSHRVFGQPQYEARFASLKYEAKCLSVHTLSVYRDYTAALLGVYTSSLYTETMMDLLPSFRITPLNAIHASPWLIRSKNITFLSLPSLSFSSNV